MNSTDFFRDFRSLCGLAAFLSKYAYFRHFGHAPTCLGLAINRFDEQVYHKNWNWNKNLLGQESFNQIFDLLTLPCLMKVAELHTFTFSA